MGAVSIELEIERLKSRGFSVGDAHSGTGSAIMVDKKKRKVAKINQDVAYNHFVEFAKNNDDLRVPEIHEFKEYGEAPFEGEHGFTIAIMEMLLPLCREDQIRYETWISEYFSWKAGGSEIPKDELMLMETINSLFEYALEKRLNIDLLKAANVMKRINGELVVIDPFN